MKSKFLVPFETAQLLKEKGYNSLCDCYYMPDKELYLGILVSNMDYEDCGNCSAPTYHEVVDWLREEYGLIVCVGFSVMKCWSWSVERLRATLQVLYCGDMQGTREEAINAAIIKALEELL